MSYTDIWEKLIIRKTLLLNEDLVKQEAMLCKKEERDFSGSLRYARKIERDWYLRQCPISEVEYKGIGDRD